MSESVNQPEVAKFIAEWKNSFQNRNFEMNSVTDQEDFLAAVTAMAKHVSHTSHRIQIFALTSKDGVSTVYWKCEV